MTLRLAAMATGYGKDKSLHRVEMIGGDTMRVTTLAGMGGNNVIKTDGSQGSITSPMGEEQPVCFRWQGRVLAGELTMPGNVETAMRRFMEGDQMILEMEVPGEPTPAVMRRIHTRQPEPEPTPALWGCAEDLMGMLEQAEQEMTDSRGGSRRW
jgi:hypothetical protein